MQIPEESWTKSYWYSPGYIHLKYVHLLRQIDFNEERIRNEGKFKRVREMLSAANLGLLVQHQMGQSAHLQLDVSERVDFFLMLATHKDGATSDLNITYVQHTSHEIDNNRSIDIASQIDKTKMKYPEHQGIETDYLLLIETSGFVDKDIKAIRQLIKSKQVDYKVFLMRGRSELSDPEGRIAAFNAPFHNIRVNFQDESTRFTAPAFFNLRRSTKDNSFRSESPRSQPYPWPDPSGVKLSY